MIKDSHFHPTIYARLTSLIDTGDFSTLISYLDSLSNAHFRTAGYMLGENLMASVQIDVFWELFVTLNEYNSRAFLVTTLKALSIRMQNEGVSLHHPSFVAYCHRIHDNEVERKKILLQLLPVLREVHDIRNLFDYLGMRNMTEWDPYLMRFQTLPCLYLLFLSLRQSEDNKDYLIRVAYYLMKQGNTLGFNFASLMKTYFGLSELKGVFSLTLKPFELARLETSYDAFVGVMRF